MAHSAHPHPSSGARVLVMGVASLVVMAVTLTPRQLVGPARALFMDLAHVFAAPLVEPMTYLELESTLNAMLFVPLGAAFAIALSRRLWVLAPLLVFCASFAIEQVQSAIPGRVPDVQDVVWNTIGGVVGAVVVGGGANDPSPRSSEASPRLTSIPSSTVRGWNGARRSSCVGPASTT